jgi:pimeloyl-ACP methyl ester carboxylesterase
VPESVAGHRVIRPDFRGHGAAERTPGSYRISDYVEDVLAVLRAEGPAILVGHSLGGVAAWTVAQRAPELVRGAFLEDPPLYRGGHLANPAVPHFRELAALARAWQAEGLSEAEARSRMVAEPEGAELTEDALSARAYALLHMDVAVLDTVVDGSLLTGTDVAAPVAAPVRVLAAGIEPAFCPDSETRLAGSHPEVEVTRMAGAGHCIHDERASRDEYFARVEAFVASA